MGFLQVHRAGASLGIDGGEALVRDHAALHQGFPLRFSSPRHPPR